MYIPHISLDATPIEIRAVPAPRKNHFKPGRTRRYILRKYSSNTGVALLRAVAIIADSPPFGSIAGGKKQCTAGFYILTVYFRTHAEKDAALTVNLAVLVDYANISQDGKLSEPRPDMD
jgi:hypothetical protein